MEINSVKSLLGGGRVLCLVVVLLLSSLSYFSVQGVQSVVGGECVVLSVMPLLDKYGCVSVNADGSFYPCDRFEVAYRVDLPGEFVFETVELAYDFSVFGMFDSNGLGSRFGSGLFEVLPSASAGTYLFCVTVWGHVFEIDPEPDWTPECFVVAEALVSVEVVMYEPPLHSSPCIHYSVWQWF
ncbi:MAG: hypothetical protein LBE76_02660 [Nitrososphaerota archaeon]|nr:hypothetical protein [Nitrososphaerota archaeon]